ncbi:MAG: SEC-C metal-binding domain-containing protein, partial [Deltaproteobacteria bacterium]
MKIGRNAPCSCGSGKKYKKCCLNKAAVPPEKLQYRRLSEVHDKLLPMFVEYGETVFGAMAPQVAFSEFRPGLILKMPRTKRPWIAPHIFSGPGVFNWEYRKFDDVDQLISGPEDMTITELFLQKKKIAPESPEGRFLMAANRSLYSFHEIVSADAGHTVNIRDVLTGREVLVQEHMGSEFMEKGDLIFGRVVQVDNVSMFMGLSANKMPPRMIPEVIQLRRKLSGARGMLSLYDLYEWDLEIRGRFWDMDRRLHSIPKIVNTDGDPMEFHKLIYDIDSVEHAVKKLADLTKTESLAEIINDAEKDENGKIKRAVFSWSRKGN